MKKSDILKLLEKRFEYLPKSEVERTVEKILQFFMLKLSQSKRIEINRLKNNNFLREMAQTWSKTV